jgi:multiple sugar transport system permease protein
LGSDSKGLEAAIRAFEKKCPQYRVKLLSMGAGGMNPQKLMTAIVGGVPPDVIDQDRFTINDWAARGAFRPLDDLIARDKGRDPETPTPEKYFPAPWAEASYQGHVYGIPTGADNRALYWNRTLFKQREADLRAAGLDPTRPPRTWSELLAYTTALTVKNKDGEVIRPGFVPNYGNSWLYLYSFENNSPFLSPDGTRCTLADPSVVESLKYMLALYNQIGGYSHGVDLAASYGLNEHDAFADGKLPLEINGDWEINNLEQFAPNLDYGVAPAPVPDDRYYHRGRFAHEKETFTTWIGGWSLAIPRGAHNVDGAWAWIKFYTSPEAKQVEWTAQRAWEQSRGQNFIPGMLASKELTQLALRNFAPNDRCGKAAYAMHVWLASKAHSRPASFASQSLWDEQARALDQAGLGNLTPEEALRQGQITVQRELDDFVASEKAPIVDLRIPTIVGLAGAAVGLGLFVCQFARRYPASRRSEARWGLVFISPWVLGFFLLTLGPMLASLFFSFTEWNVLRPAHWVGLRNYSDLLGENRAIFFHSLVNVCYVGGIGVPLGLFTSLAIALLLNAGVRAIGAYRAFFFVPSLVPTVASAAIWLWILAPDPTRGLANSLWQETFGKIFGLSPPAWFSAAEWARPALIIMGLWGAGGGMVLWLAGLKTLPNSLFEAARIDGATSGKQFWKITFPQLSPIVFFSTVVGFIGAIQQFEQNYVVTNGTGAGPDDSLLSPAYYLFTAGFGYFKMGYASAIAWIMFLLVLALTAVQFVASKRWVFYEVDQ